LTGGRCLLVVYREKMPPPTPTEFLPGPVHDGSNGPLPLDLKLRLRRAGGQRKRGVGPAVFPRAHRREKPLGNSNRTVEYEGPLPGVTFRDPERRSNEGRKGPILIPGNHKHKPGQIWKKRFIQPTVVRRSRTTRFLPRAGFTFGGKAARFYSRMK